MTSSVEVRVDDRLRLAGALLAAGTWPDGEQAAKAYKPHRVAEGARKYFAPYGEHPAVLAAQAVASTAAGVVQLFQFALSGAWPEGEFARQVEAFQSASQPETYWTETQADWKEAEDDARSIMGRADLAQFLADLFGAPLFRPPTYHLILTPNLLFPGQQSVVVSTAEDVVVCAPPPKAWGTSPPWRYRERPDEVLAMFAEAFAYFFFERALPPDETALREHSPVLAVGAAVLFLRQAEGDAAGDQFMIMEKRTRSLDRLPAVVAALERILAARRAGQSIGFGDYLTGLRLQLLA